MCLSIKCLEVSDGNTFSLVGKNLGWEAWKESSEIASEWNKKREKKTCFCTFACSSWCKELFVRCCCCSMKTLTAMGKAYKNIRMGQERKLKRQREFRGTHKRRQLCPLGIRTAPSQGTAVGAGRTAVSPSAVRVCDGLPCSEPSAPKSVLISFAGSGRAFLNVLRLMKWKRPRLEPSSFFPAITNVITAPWNQIAFKTKAAPC